MKRRLVRSPPILRKAAGPGPAPIEARLPQAQPDGVCAFLPTGIPGNLATATVGVNPVAPLPDSAMPSVRGRDVVPRPRLRPKPAGRLAPGGTKHAYSTPSASDRLCRS